MSRRTFRIPGSLALLAGSAILATGCGSANATRLGEASDAAQRVYVAPGQYDEFYAFLSGGFNGQVARVRPAVRPAAQARSRSSRSIPRTAGATTKRRSRCCRRRYGFVPWDDAHHAELSQTDGVPDGRWLFINGNNTPRVARIDLTTFETDEILEIPNAAGGHASPFTTPDTKYIVSATRFSVPIPNTDVADRRATRRTSRARCRSSRPTSRARWTSRSRS